MSCSELPEQTDSGNNCHEADLKGERLPIRCRLGEPRRGPHFVVPRQILIGMRGDPIRELVQIFLTVRRLPPCHEQTGDPLDSDEVPGGAQNNALPVATPPRSTARSVNIARRMRLMRMQDARGERRCHSLRLRYARVLSIREQWYSIRYPRPAGSSNTLLGSSTRYSFISDSQSALVLVPGWTRHSRPSFASGLSAGMKRRQGIHAS